MIVNVSVKRTYVLFSSIDHLFLKYTFYIVIYVTV